MSHQRMAIVGRWLSTSLMGKGSGSSRDIPRRTDIDSTREWGHCYWTDCRRTAKVAAELIYCVFCFAALVSSLVVLPVGGFIREAKFEVMFLFAKGTPPPISHISISFLMLLLSLRLFPAQQRAALEQRPTRISDDDVEMTDERLDERTDDDIPCSFTACFELAGC